MGTVEAATGKSDDARIHVFSTGCHSSGVKFLISIVADCATASMLNKNGNSKRAASRARIRRRRNRRRSKGRWVGEYIGALGRIQIDLCFVDCLLLPRVSTSGSQEPLFI